MPKLAPSRLALPLALALSVSLLALTLVACGKKGGGLTVLDAQNREAASLPSLRPLSLPPRYNLDGGQASLSQPSASLNEDGSLSVGKLTAQETDATNALLLANDKKSSSEKKSSRNQNTDKAFLQELLAGAKIDTDIRREIAEDNKQPVPISNPLLKAIRQNNEK